MHCSWIEADKELKKSMIILMENMKKTIRFQVLNLINLNLETFVQVKKLQFFNDFVKKKGFFRFSTQHIQLIMFNDDTQQP